MNNIYLKNISEHFSMKKEMEDLNHSVNEAGKICATKIIDGGKILICGNGGSSADSQHFAAELTGRFFADRRPLPALSLTTDTSAITAISNDYSFDDVFSRQVSALGGRNDLLIGISTSGNSKNIINAISEANKIGMTTIGLSGKDGGLMKNIAKFNIIVPSTVTARIQEFHILILHTFCEIIEKEIF